MSTGIKHALSTIIVLAIIFVLSYIISLDSLLLNGIPLVYIFVLTILSINSLFFIHSYFFKTDIFFDLIGSISFISIGILSLILIPSVDGNQILIFFLLIFWALRLGPYLFLRRLGSGADERLDEYFKSPLSLYFLWVMNSLWVFMTSISMIVIFSSKDNYEFTLVQCLELYLDLVC